MINNNNNNNIVNMITRQMTPLSTSILWTLSVGISYFCISRPSKFSSMRYPLCMFWSCRIYIYMSKMTLSSLLTKTSFLYRNLANFWYITRFVPNLIPSWPQSHGLYELNKKNNYGFFFLQAWELNQTCKFQKRKISAGPDCLAAGTNKKFNFTHTVPKCCGWDYRHSQI